MNQINTHSFTERQIKTITSSVTYAGLFSIFIILRLAHASNHGLWLDEMYTESHTSDGWIDLFEYVFISHGDIHPPLHLFYAKIMRNLIGGSDLALKIISMLPQSVIFLHMLKSQYTCELFGNIGRASFLSILTLSPYLIYSGTEFRQYSLLMMLLYFTVIYTHKVITKVPSKTDIALLGVGAAMAIFTQYVAVLAIGSIWLSVLIVYPRPGESAKRLAMASSIPIALLIPYIPVLLAHLDRGLHYARGIDEFLWYIQTVFGSAFGAFILLGTFIYITISHIFRKLMVRNHTENEAQTCRVKFLILLGTATTFYLVFAFVYSISQNYNSTLLTFGASVSLFIILIMGVSIAIAMTGLRPFLMLSPFLVLATIPSIICAYEDPRYFESNRVSYVALKHNSEQFLTVLNKTPGTTILTSARYYEIRRYFNPVVSRLHPKPTIERVDRKQFSKAIIERLHLCKEDKMNTFVIADRFASQIVARATLLDSSIISEMVIDNILGVVSYDCESE